MQEWIYTGLYSLCDKTDINITQGVGKIKIKIKDEVLFGMCVFLFGGVSLTFLCASFCTKSFALFGLAVIVLIIGLVSLSFCQVSICRYCGKEISNGGDCCSDCRMVNKFIFKKGELYTTAYQASKDAWLNTKNFSKCGIFDSEKYDIEDSDSKYETEYFTVVQTGKFNAIVMFTSYEEMIEFFDNMGCVLDAIVKEQAGGIVLLG